MLKLIIEDDEGRKTVVPFVRDEITIGRQEGNTIRLTERNVSRRHARLMKTNAAVLIEDLGSYNGVRINGDRIAGQVQVGDGDLIQIGDYDLALQADEASATVPLDTARTQVITARLPVVETGATIPSLPLVDVPQASDDDVESVGSDEPPELARHQATAVIRADQVEGNPEREVSALDASEAPRLVVLNTDFAGREFPCTLTEMKIGRTDDNDVALDHRSLSRTHCKLVREENGEWRVIDLQSANGLMVNGEPYAQVTLRYGDTLELGHVKLQFLGPGESPSLQVSPTSVTQQTAAPGTRAPVLAIAAAAAVIIIGGGGYALYKSRSATDPGPVRKPPAPLVEAAPPRPEPVPEAAPVPVPAPVQPAAPDPEVARRAVAQKLAEANVAFEALDWAKAEELLQGARVDGALVPEAQQLLSRLNAEKGFRAALDEAGRLLDQGNDEKAQPLLDSARATRLQGKQLAELTARARKLQGERLDKQKQAAAPKSEPPPGKPSAAAELYNEANDLARRKQYDAAVMRLDRCVKADPAYYNCFKLLGSMHARISARDGSASDQELARKNYERFIELAPPEDEAVPKVRKILDEAP